MRDSGEPRYRIYEQDDPEKLRNELLLSFFIPAAVTVAVLALAFRFVIGDVLTTAHPGFAEPINWGAGKYSGVWSQPRMQLLTVLTCGIVGLYYWAYLRYFRDWFRARGWV